MIEADLYNLLDECIEQLRSGVSLDEVLKKYPAQTTDLRPLLEAAWKAVLHKPGEPIPATASNHSRAALLARAVQLRQLAETKSKRLPFFSRAYRTAALSIVVIFTLTFTGLASATTLPGDLLYPIKINLERAGQALILDKALRKQDEVDFDLRRASEVKELLNSGRSETVNFGGFLTLDDSRVTPNWYVDQIPLVFSPGFDIPLEALENSFVELTGVTQPQGEVLVENLALRLFHLKGKIEQLNPDAWMVDGMTVGITPQTHIAGSPERNAKVEITMILLPGSKWVAIIAKVEGALLSDIQITQPIETNEPEVTMTSEVDDDMNEDMASDEDEIDDGESNDDVSENDVNDDDVSDDDVSDVDESKND